MLIVLIWAMHIDPARPNMANNWDTKNTLMGTPVCASMNTEAFDGEIAVNVLKTSELPGSSHCLIEEGSDDCVNSGLPTEVLSADPESMLPVENPAKLDHLQGSEARTRLEETTDDVPDGEDGEPGNANDDVNEEV